GDSTATTGASASSTGTTTANPPTGSTTDATTAGPPTTSGASEGATTSTTTTGSTTEDVSVSGSSTGFKFDTPRGDDFGGEDTDAPMPTCHVVDDMDAIGDCDKEAPPDSFEPEV